MILNRKSAKSTSRASLMIAITMLFAIGVVMQTHGYEVEYLAENGVRMCKMGAVDLFMTLLW
jgi:hypothetical protein